MKKPTTITSESVSEYREFVQLRLRKQVLEALGIVIDEELDQALGCGAYERSEERRGYRNGGETRRVTTAMGTRGIRVPRARLRDEQTGETKEFRSQLLPRYQRRTREVDEAILATYLSGANSRRIRKALKPLLGDDLCLLFIHPRAPNLIGLRVVSKNTNELKTRVASRTERMVRRKAVLGPAYRRPRPVPKLGPFEIDHKSAA